MGPGPGNITVGLRLRTKLLSRRVTKSEVAMKAPGGRSRLQVRAQIRIVPQVAEETSEFKNIQLLKHMTSMGSVYYCNVPIRATCRTLLDFIALVILTDDPSGRAARGESWPVDCWDRGLEFRSMHVCSSSSFCVVLSCVGRGVASSKEFYQLSKNTVSKP
jgi:hypothetical protein